MDQGPARQGAARDPQSVARAAAEARIRAGAVLLLLLRRHAYRLLAGAFALGILLTLYQILTRNWLGAVGGAGLVGAVIGWVISIAVILYARGLMKKGVLR
jgi:hypothetical protein